jgi:hypothetical protein
MFPFTVTNNIRVPNHRWSLHSLLGPSCLYQPPPAHARQNRTLHQPRHRHPDRCHANSQRLSHGARTGCHRCVYGGVEGGVCDRDRDCRRFIPVQLLFAKGEYSSREVEGSWWRDGLSVLMHWLRVAAFVGALLWHTPYSCVFPLHLNYNRL